MFDELDQALDKESWIWLSENLSDIAAAVEAAIARGASPEQIRRRVMVNSYRMELAQRCEMAARWLMRSKHAG